MSEVADQARSPVCTKPEITCAPRWKARQNKSRVLLGGTRLEGGAKVAGAQATMLNEWSSPNAYHAPIPDCKDVGRARHEQKAEELSLKREVHINRDIRY